MSLMFCNKCKTLYGPTLLTCPSCGSGDVSVASIESLTSKQFKDGMKQSQQLNQPKPTKPKKK